MASKSEAKLHPPFSSKISFNEGIVQEAVTTSQNTNIPVAEHFNALLPVFCQGHLNISRLDALYPWLWLAGLPARPNALHAILLQNKRFNRKIVITERADIHLVLAEKALYMKPLPAYLLDYYFWREHLLDSFELHSIALGLLVGYASMIRSQIDFQAAVHGDGDGLSLLPPGLTWPQWALFIKDLTATIGVDAPLMHRRFDYALLRLNRLSLLYRAGVGNLMCGYYSGEEHMAWYDFWERDIAWILVFLAFVLTAMQVGLATETLNKNDAFQSVSYGTTVFCLVLPVASIILLLTSYSVLFLHNYIQIVVNMRYSRRKQRGEQ